MQYLIFLEDLPGSETARAERLQEHLRFVRTHLDRILVAGPRLASGGEMIGSTYIIEADSVEEARGFLQQDPYWHANIWREPRISGFSGVAGRWVGGVNW